MRPVIRAAIRHTHCLFAYCFSLPPCFSSNTTRHPFVYPLFMPVSFFVSSYLVSKGVSFLYRLVHTCRIRYTAPSGLAHRVLFAPVSSPSVARSVAIIPSTSPYISIIFSYSCILVSFIYIAYIIFIIYINRQVMTSPATIAKHPAAPSPVLRPVVSNQASKTR